MRDLIDLNLSDDEMCLHHRLAPPLLPCPNFDTNVNEDVADNNPFDFAIKQVDSFVRDSMDPFELNLSPVLIHINDSHQDFSILSDSLMDDTALIGDEHSVLEPLQISRSSSDEFFQLTGNEKNENLRFSSPLVPSTFGLMNMAILGPTPNHPDCINVNKGRRRSDISDLVQQFNRIKKGTEAEGKLIDFDDETDYGRQNHTHDAIAFNFPYQNKLDIMDFTRHYVMGKASANVTDSRVNKNSPGRNIDPTLSLIQPPDFSMLPASDDESDDLIELAKDQALRDERNAKLNSEEEELVKEVEADLMRSDMTNKSDALMRIVELKNIVNMSNKSEAAKLLDDLENVLGLNCNDNTNLLSTCLQMQNQEKTRRQSSKEKKLDTSNECDSDQPDVKKLFSNLEKLVQDSSTRNLLSNLGALLSKISQPGNRHLLKGSKLAKKVKQSSKYNVRQTKSLSSYIKPHTYTNHLPAAGLKKPLRRTINSMLNTTHNQELKVQSRFQDLTTGSKDINNNDCDDMNGGSSKESKHVSFSKSEIEDTKVEQLEEVSSGVGVKLMNDIKFMKPKRISDDNEAAFKTHPLKVTLPGNFTQIVESVQQKKEPVSNCNISPEIERTPIATSTPSTKRVISKIDQKLVKVSEKEEQIFALKPKILNFRKEECLMNTKPNNQIRRVPKYPLNAKRGTPKFSKSMLPRPVASQIDASSRIQKTTSSNQLRVNNQNVKMKSFLVAPKTNRKVDQQIQIEKKNQCAL